MWWFTFWVRSTRKSWITNFRSRNCCAIGKDCEPMPPPTSTILDPAVKVSQGNPIMMLGQRLCDLGYHPTSKNWVFSFAVTNCRHGSIEGYSVMFLLRFVQPGKVRISRFECVIEGRVCGFLWFSGVPVEEVFRHVSTTFHKIPRTEIRVNWVMFSQFNKRLLTVVEPWQLDRYCLRICQREGRNYCSDLVNCCSRKFHVCSTRLRGHRSLASWCPWQTKDGCWWTD